MTRQKGRTLILPIAWLLTPSGLTYAPEGVTREDAAFLQRIAWTTVRR